MNTKITATMLRGYPDLMTPKDIQEILRIGRSKAYNLLQSGELRCIRVGVKYLIPKAFLLEYFNNSA
jgi:excisionase family DNA binding protein